MDEERRRRHIQSGGRAFLPLSRMRHIRWEESVSRSRLKRDGVLDPKITHHNCSCGFIECQGVPFVRAV